MRVCVSPVFGMIDSRDFPAVDLQMALAPGSDIDLELVASGGCHKFLNRSTFSRGQV
jgi:hypothetical protein